MQRKFLTNLAFLLFLNLLVKPFWILGVDRSVQNAVGAQSYGDYSALLNFSFLLNILLDVGITNFNNRNITQNRQLLAKHFSGIFSLKLLLGIGYLLLIALSGWVLGYSSRQFYFLGFLAFNQFLVSLLLYLRSNLAGLHLFKADSILSVLDRALMIGICSVLLWSNWVHQPFRIEWFIYAQTASYGLSALVATILVIRKATVFRPRWDPAFALMILKKSAPYALLILFMTFYNRLDGVMLERLLPDGAQQAGIYAQGYRLLDAANMIGFLFAGLLLPLFSRMLKQQEPVRELAGLSFRLIMAGAIFLAITCFFFREPLMELMYTEHFDTTPLVFALLMTSFIPIGTTYIFGTLLTAEGHMKTLNMVAGAGVALNLVLNLILIPEHHATGAAMATLITQGLTALVQALIARRRYRIPLSRQYILSFLLFTSGMVALGGYFTQTGAGLLVSVLAMTTGGLLLAFLSRFIALEELATIIRRNE